MSTIAASVSPKLLELETSNLVHGFVSGMTSGRTDSCVWSKKTFVVRLSQNWWKGSTVLLGTVGVTFHDWLPFHTLKIYIFEWCQCMPRQVVLICGTLNSWSVNLMVWFSAAVFTQNRRMDRVTVLTKLGLVTNFTTTDQCFAYWLTTFADSF